MTELLLQYAENADEEHVPIKKNNSFSNEVATEARQTEKAQSLMESLFRKLIHGQKNPPDNRRFAAYFLAL